MNILKSVAVCFVLFATVAVRGQNVVADWDAVSLNTIVTVGLKPPSSAPIFFAYVDGAVYDAVNSITREHHGLAVTVDAPRRASVDAAVVASAHDILVHYFPAQAPTLNAAESASLGAIAYSPEKTEGIEVGQAVAAQWIALRANDGLEAPIQFVWGHGPGIWEPVPPFPPPATPWMASFKPFTYENASDFLSSITPPLPLASREWADDYNLTKAYGALNGSARTPKETEIGLFWTDFPAAIFSRAMRSLISENKLDTAESARLAAMQYVSLADSLIACFNGKYHYAFWRPYTAIHDSDTSINPDTVPDPNWLPLAVTPGHPEYPAAHGCATESVAVAIRTFFHKDKVHYEATSNVTNTVHDFRRLSDLVDEVDRARIYGGMHFHHSVLQGNVMGRTVTCHALESHFEAHCIEGDFDLDR